MAEAEETRPGSLDEAAERHHLHPHHGGVRRRLRDPDQRDQRPRLARSARLQRQDAKMDARM